FSTQEMPAPGQDLVEEVRSGEQRWRVWRRGLRASPPPTRPPEEGHQDAKPRYQALVFAVAVPLDPIGGELRRLAWVLAGLAAGGGLAAAVAGRWLCRRALRPLARMEGAARAIHAEALQQRLPVPATGDELERLAVTFNDLLGRLE